MTGWQRDFFRLKQFVEGCGDIKVTSERLSVPGDRKEEFYHLVEEVQKALGMQVLGEYQEMGSALASRFAQMRQQMAAGANLKEFTVARAIENLLEDPKMGMAKPAFWIVLDGLQQELSVEAMEDRAKREVVPFCKDLLRGLYESWLYYSIVAALKPVRFYGVDLQDKDAMRAVQVQRVAAGFQEASRDKRMPEAVFITEDDRVFAMKSEIADELQFYVEKPGRGRNFFAGGDAADRVAHRALLLYRLGSLDRIPLLADREKRYFLPADLMCEFLLPQEMERPVLLAGFEKRVRTARSRRPVQVLTWDESGSFPDGFLKDSSGGCQVLVERTVVGMDAGKLPKIAAVLRDR